jgi:hypothetical protein
MRLLVHWIYNLELDILQLENEAIKNSEYQFLAQLWVLADKLLMDNTIRKINEIQQDTNIIQTTYLDHVYENTSPGFALRKLRLMAAVLSSQ